MKKQLEKAVGLLAVCLAFYPNKQSESTFWLFKDIVIKSVKQGIQIREKITDKFERLLRND